MIDLRTPEKKFRPELEGIRAVAALLVAIYHIWLGSVSGGVDVFFIVSGYLITTSLVSRMEREGRIHLGDYLLGLGKRLFPIAFIVLLFTTVFSILILPKARWVETIPEIFASAFYFQNWQLANTAVDYLGQNNAASPFQHFWALSIQGQFYVTWPLVIGVVYLIAKKILKMPVRKTLLTVLSFIFIVSISYSVYITAENQPWAYFDTFARAWEFSLGGMLALLIPYLKFHKSVSFVMGWLGLAIIALTGVLLPVSTVFPGYAALLPTGGVMLVIIAAEAGSRFGVEKLLGSKPFLYFGSISYGFYLWHWPLLIFYYSYFGKTAVSNLAGILILVSAFVLSIVSIKLLESPVRKMNVKTSKGKLSLILVAFILPVMLVGGSWKVYVDQSQSRLDDYTLSDHPGARAISENVTPNPDIEPIPSAIEAKHHLPTLYESGKCSSSGTSSVATTCSFGELENPEYTIALVGGSHSGHWFPALEEMSEELNLQIDVYIKDACRFSTDDFDGLLTEACMDWNDNIMDSLIENPPDLVFTTANINNQDIIPEGYLSKWAELQGITKVFAVRDNPRMNTDIPLCVEENGADECSEARENVLSALPPWENTENIPNNVYFADMSEYFCDDETCPPVIGNVLVYRDRHHISTVYAETMAPALKEHIVKALGK